MAGLGSGRSGTVCVPRFYARLRSDAWRHLRNTERFELDHARAMGLRVCWVPVRPRPI